VDVKSIYLTIVLAPLIGAILAGFFGRQIGRIGAHSVTILGVAISTALSLYVLKGFIDGNDAFRFNESIYTWMVAGGIRFEVGFLVDSLTALMMVVVTFVSLMVHIYTIGYMKDDPGYQRFFSYISLFTFSMLMLVMANNFTQLFFGWEAVGLVSYLLIGFWYKRPTAIFANLKAFLVNRVGDFGFLLGIGLVVFYFGSLNYTEVFSKAAADPTLATQTIELIPGHAWSLMTVVCILLFIGAMGKSAQAPLHVWLPDSMEGPTPISALIHAATMVTAGIFMVSRMSPLFEMSDTALSFVMLTGAFTAFFMGLIGLVQNDIKRVVAYSTLSQLGYMTVALGVSAYSAAIFHLMTHAFFKALLFLAAGSVIMGMHHQQDMRFMGGLRKYMPITFLTAWIGTIALTGFPGTSGFFSKDLIIEAVGASDRYGASIAYAAVLIGVLITSIYSFRLLYLTFHGAERHADAHHDDHAAHDPHAADDHAHDDHHHGGGKPHESPWVVTVPLLLLAVPSLAIGWFTAKPLLFDGWLKESIIVKPANDVVAELGQHFHTPLGFALEGFKHWPFWLMLAGFVVATVLYKLKPGLAGQIAHGLRWPVRVLNDKYGFDRFYQAVFAGGSLSLGRAFWRFGDRALIDGAVVDGSASTVGRFSELLKRIQSGYLYDYAFVMIVGLLALLMMFVLGR
jgi:NADH-quinone oxidoreductase subunit L